MLRWLRRRREPEAQATHRTAQVVTRGPWLELIPLTRVEVKASCVLATWAFKFTDAEGIEHTIPLHCEGRN